MQDAVSTLLDWHCHASRRWFLAVALRELLSLIRSCSALVFTDESARSGDATVTTTTAAVRMLLWHWQATASLLCARSDSVINIRDSIGPATVLESTLAAVAAQITQRHAVRYDFDVARLRQLCVLLDLVRATIKTNQGQGASVFTNASSTATSTIVVFLVRLLELAIKRQDASVVGLIENLLRSALVELGGGLVVVETQEEARVVAAQLVGCLLRTAGKTAVGPTERRSSHASDPAVRSTVEKLVADIVIARQLPISTLMLNLLDDESAESVVIQVVSPHPNNWITGDRTNVTCARSSSSLILSRALCRWRARFSVELMSVRPQKRSANSGGSFDTDVHPMSSAVAALWFFVADDCFIMRRESGHS